MSAESSLSQFPVCTLFKLLVATGLALFLASCAGTSSGSKPRHQFERIAIIAFSETREDLQADSPAKMYTTGFLAGGAGGAAAGAAIGLSCGPGAVFCVPFMAWLVGTNSAALGGAVRGGKGMTKAHREQLNEVLGNQRARLDVNEMLRRSLSTALPDGIESPESDARTRVQVQVKSLDLRQHRDEKLSLKLTATMKISWNLEDRTPSRKNNRYQHETARIAVHVWLNAGGERFSSEVADCMDHIAAEMARDLGYPVELESG